MTTSVLWFRRDLRLADHPALLAARDEPGQDGNHAGSEVVPLFVLDDALRRPSGAPRLAFLYRCLRDLHDLTSGALRVVAGRPEDVVPRVARQVGAAGVHVTSDHGPYGRGRDERVQEALMRLDQPVPLVATGSPYAVPPGVLRKADGEPYRVYSPYHRAWVGRGVHPPALTPRSVRWSDGGVRSDGVPADPDLGDVVLPAAGETAGLQRWRQFRADDLAGYAEHRDSPAVDGTSRLSVYLRHGCLHARTLLADLGDGDGPAAFRRELAWRDFYADVLWHRPDSARSDLTPALAGMAHDDGAEADRRFAAWAAGRTGYPFVDAGMRELRGQAWVHNRVRMVVASFLVKDLHLPWWRGARHFMRHLRDGDLASNSHGWQWVAGTGTDAAPYFRVFNPVTQGLQHDPDGDYVRRWVPELRGVEGPAVHEPWRLRAQPAGYPEPIVDHKAEREEALRRYAAVRGR